MGLVLLILLVLVHSPIVPSFGLSKPVKACGTFHVACADDPTRELFYIDGKLVDKYLFCKSLRFHGRDCFLRKHVRSHYCHSLGRRLLKPVVRDGDSWIGYGEKSPSGNDENGNRIVKSNMLVIAVPGFFLLCCALICPCFQARKRATEHTVLSKEPNSMDSITSLEMNPPFEKYPGSPLRAPPSPLRVPPSPSRFSMSPKLNRLGSVHLNMNQVARATHNFSSSLLIGEGGFGTVYKAELPNGQVVAIKRARREHFEALRTEFRSEVELLAKIDHRNLVKLLGYVEKGNERLIITDYVPNGTLREHLDGLKGKILDFNQRLEICIDIAHGLTYLHLYAEKKIIHRDVKSSNILLTESLRAKVADFGFARLGDESDKTHVSTKVKGTVGYLDPEYMRTYQLTDKSDVYSFGILLIEILTGRRPVDLKRHPDERVTIKWAFRKFNEGKYREMVDPLMTENVDEEILVKMFGLAMQCAAPTRGDRPDMKSVGEQLWGIRMDYLKSGMR
ncbi:calmodulin-binding receptor-like cytoplasmic kinase 3 [Andrographis paniculata]|uniref:calmodulin-binding receptor-like cytoplasmic kinase 3 n=1 Tax=Andrographis paniculata TaxID=175694 RepID=UPI0021E7C51E|nr:calmodulin-binding receptor-like cytoplasmic kinase 3 [Andrographis paniculata]XP_051127949.1 calmodulin-binding receptor-like cytoplasmic kinase 3 [Andrographis paniculata]XP_051127951.1 calmodulin-binding receptor-like cytoplasmic kinase 3 [Andrographis paniculata]